MKRVLDNYGKPRLLYYWRIWLMSDQDLFRETKNKIWLSAYANNNPRSDYHWHVSACYEEWDRRHQSEKYKEAYEETYAETVG